MNLYLLQQSVNNHYDTFDSCVVSAETEDQARSIIPGYIGEWAKPEDVTATLIGIASDSIPSDAIIIASFNAG